MQFQELERFRLSHSKWSSLIQSADEYLFKVLTESSGKGDVVPSILARKLNISETDATALLYLFQQAGLICPQYDVYCPETEKFIRSFESKEQIPDELYCRHHDGRTFHQKDEVLVEIVFGFTSKALEYLAVAYA